MFELEILRIYSSPTRDSFGLEKDCYDGWVILAAKSGSFHYAIEGISKDHELAEFGDLIFCPPGHTLWREACSKFSFLFVEFSSSMKLQVGKTHISDTTRLSSTLRYLPHWQQETVEQIPEDEVPHLVADLLFLASREWNRKNATLSSRGTDPLMDRAAQRIVQGAFEGKFSLHLLAQQLSITSSQLTRRFTAAFGMPPIRYMTLVKLSRAQTLLTQTDLTLDEIAEQCGYQNAFYFSRVFTKHMQLNPSAYRKKYQI